MNKIFNNSFSKLELLLALALLPAMNIYAQYNKDYVETSSVFVGGEKVRVVKMSRKDNRVKAKYFAAKDYNGTSVYQRYTEWARNKNIIAVSSGTYMDDCNASIAKPVGLCIDNGNLVNNTLREDLDALVIVYATGGIAVSNLDDKNLTVTYTATKTSKVLDIRNAFDRTEFINWAKIESATVFQSHLFCFKNNLEVYSNANSDKKPRRFLVACKDEKGIIFHCIINMSGANSIYESAVKAKDYLVNTEDMSEVVYMFNLDTGCQDVFEARKSDGSIDFREGFSGAINSNTANLVVYYYE